MAIKINIASLQDGSQQLDIVSDAKEIGLEEALVKDTLNIKLDLTKTTHQLDIRASISGNLDLECDRCLEEYKMPFNSGFEVVFVQKSPREEEINDDYIRTYYPHMRQVDITNDIRETIVLTVPMKKVPAEKPDGSCSWCGRGKDFWNGIIVNEEDLEK
jgi:uncharacterized protein